MTSLPHPFLQAATELLPSIRAVYDELMQFEECQGWAATQLLAYRDYLDQENAPALHSLLMEMQEQLEFEIHDGGYGYSFVVKLEDLALRLERLRRSFP